MMTKFLRSAALLALCHTGAASAQTAAPAAATAATVDADPALWVVKDADTTIYLFGTVHVLKPGLSWFDEAVKTAFDKSDQLVLEMVQPDAATMQALVMKTGFTTSGPTLTEKLAEPDRAKYLAALAGFGIPANAFDRADPWIAAVNLSLLPIMKLGYDPESVAEKVLSNAAAAENKPVTGLETAEQQLGYFDTLPEPLQIKYLNTTVKDLPKAGPEIDKMVAQWAKGDAVGLAETMNEGIEESPELFKILLADRNMRWADWIDNRLKTPGTVFIAVGAGHLAGTESVQAQLAKHKLTATRITY